MHEIVSHIKKHKHIYILFSFIIVCILLISIFSKKVEAPVPYSANSTVSSPSPVNKSQRIEGQIVVKYKPNVTEYQIKKDLAGYKATIINRIPELQRLIIQVPKDQTDAILKKLSQNGLIENAEPDYNNHTNVAVNDPSFGNQWGLNNTGQSIEGKAGTAGSDIDIERAWTVTRGKGVTVGIVDTGVNMNHPDLVGKIAATKNIVTGSTNVEDNQGHGTHVSGVIGANTNNGVGIAGVCPECQLVVAATQDSQGNIADSSIAGGITWATNQGAKVVSVSQGGEHAPSQVILDALKFAAGKGATVVAAAPNCGGSNYADNGCSKINPTTYSPTYVNGVVSVTAVDSNDQRAGFASYGTNIKISAPGAKIFSTVPTHEYELKNIIGTLTYGYLSGTSQATPMVSGVLALIRSTSYGTTASAAVARLYATADKIPGTGSLWQYGRVNAGNAVGAAVQPSGAVPVPTFSCLGSCPTAVPTEDPNALPTEDPNTMPTEDPNAMPTEDPNAMPTQDLSIIPTDSAIPTVDPNILLPTIGSPQLGPTTNGGLLPMLIQFFSLFFAIIITLLSKGSN